MLISYIAIANGLIIGMPRLISANCVEDFTRWTFNGNSFCDQGVLDNIVAKATDVVQLYTGLIANNCSVSSTNGAQGFIFGALSAVKLAANVVFNVSGVFFNGVGIGNNLTLLAKEGLQAILFSAKPSVIQKSINYTIDTAGSNGMRSNPHCLQMLSATNDAPITVVLKEKSAITLQGSILKSFSIEAEDDTQIELQGTQIKGFAVYGSTENPSFYMTTDNASSIDGFAASGAHAELEGAGEFSNIQLLDVELDIHAQTTPLVWRDSIVSERCLAESQTINPPIMNASSQEAYNTAIIEEQSACTGQATPNIVANLTNNFKEIVPPSPSPVPTPVSTPTPIPTPKSIPTSIPTSTPIPSPYTPEDKNSPWWPYAMPLLPITAFFVTRILAVRNLSNKEEFSQQCFLLMRKNSCFNMLITALAGVTLYYHQEMGWDRYDEAPDLALLAAAAIPLEGLLNLIAERYDAYVEKRNVDFKSVLLNISVPTAIAGLMTGFSLFYLFPNISAENFLVASFGTQLLRQTFILSVEYIRIYYASLQEPVDLLLNTQSESNNGDDISATPASCFFGMARVLSHICCAVSITTMVVAGVLFLDEKRSGGDTHYNSVAGASLKASVSANVGGLATNIVILTAMAGNKAYDYMVPRLTNCFATLFSSKPQNVDIDEDLLNSNSSYYYENIEEDLSDPYSPTQ